VDARKLGGATAPATRADKTAALNRLIARCPERLLIIVRTFEGEELAEYDLPAADGPQPTHEAGPSVSSATPPPPVPRRKPHPCRRLIIEILSDHHPRRMTRPEIVAELDARGGEWSEKTVQRLLEDLTGDGRVDNEKDANGQGYGFCP
jgi:hypothetical protein